MIIWPRASNQRPTKKETILLDTGDWFALADRSDGYHAKAVAIYLRLLKEFQHLVTTNLVVAESYDHHFTVAGFKLFP